MTYLICQCPSEGDATVWTADSTAKIMAVAGDGHGGLAFTDALSAVSHGMLDAHVTTDKLNLWLWISKQDERTRIVAQRAYLACRSIVGAATMPPRAAA